jgi:predicted NUDIX family NTP pyrophosphohydrolase
MTPKTSAGLLLHRGPRDALEVLLVHPGGPFWARRDAGAWSIPKGEYQQPEAPVDAARREFAEELGMAPPPGPMLDLGVARQRSGKLIHAWALAANLDVSAIRSSSFEMVWPPRSGVTRTFPEVDRAQWFDLAAAREKLLSGQVPFLDALTRLLDADA